MDPVAADDWIAATPARDHTSVLYVLLVGLVGDVRHRRRDVAIHPSVPPHWAVLKYGRTVNLRARLIQHRPTFGGGSTLKLCDSVDLVPSEDVQQVAEDRVRRLVTDSGWTAERIAWPNIKEVFVVGPEEWPRFLECLDAINHQFNPHIDAMEIDGIQRMPVGTVPRPAKPCLGEAAGMATCSYCTNPQRKQACQYRNLVIKP